MDKMVTARHILQTLSEAASDDREHAKANRETGYWGKKGAGVLFLAKDTGRFLFAHRSGEVNEPNTFGIWGGAIDADEDPAEAAAREAEEEAGAEVSPEDMKLMWTFHDQKAGFKFYDFVALVPHEFKPELDWETQGHEWVKFGDWPQPLHPGVRAWFKDPARLKELQALVPKDTDV